MEERKADNKLLKFCTILLSGKQAKGKSSNAIQTEEVGGIFKEVVNIRSSDICMAITFWDVKKKGNA